MTNKSPLILTLLEYCEKHRIEFRPDGVYPNALRAARKNNLRTSAGLLYHLPDGASLIPSTTHRARAVFRVYLCWTGEPLEEVIESIAFLRMMCDRHIMIVNCKEE